MGFHIYSLPIHNLNMFRNHVKYIPSNQNPPDWDHLRPPSDQLWTVLRSQRKIRLWNLSSFKTNVLISLSHQYQAVFPCTKILVWVVLGKLLFISGNKKSFCSLTHCDLASFLTTFQHNKTAAKQARGLGTAALKFVFSKKATKIDKNLRRRFDIT